MNYISNTTEEKEKMLAAIGINSIEELFKAIPEGVLFQENLNIPPGLSEMELLKEVKEKAALNKTLDEVNSFLGAGAYDHYIPAVIDHIVSRSEFYTAYTPYQAELSQGSLQAIYEYQSMICELTGMDVANASLLDGGSAVGEAVLMASRITRKKKIIIPETIHPIYREIAKTYGKQQDLTFTEIDIKNTKVDITKLKEELDDDTAALVIQYPNFTGSIEDMSQIQKLINSRKRTLLIMVVNPIALAIYKSPANFGADIVVGEGQPLGNPINYGGPYLGFMACQEKYTRQMPGRIVGATTDVKGKKGYVMTLQTREQHIRRGKATSNICTNEALNALVATIYLSLMGKNGLKEVAEHCLKKAHYLAERIDKIPGFDVMNPGSFFHEFLVETPVNSKDVYNQLKQKGILPGLCIESLGYDEEGLLICVTEKKTLDELEELISALEVIAGE